MFESIIASTGITIEVMLLCSAISVLLGLAIAIVYRKCSDCTKNYLITLALLPLLVQVVIMMTNGNLGTSVAVLGAFSLIRFRSQPGNSKEIVSVFFAMAVGLATGTGYVGYAVLFFLIAECLFVLLTKSPLGEQKKGLRELKVTIPEDLDYEEVFDDVFEKYTDKAVLTQVKTTNMGSLFELTYDLETKEGMSDKEMIDQIRMRNGNLTVLLRRPHVNAEQL